MKQTSYLLTLLLVAMTTVGFAQKELQIEFSVKDGETFSNHTKAAILRANSKYSLYIQTNGYTHNNGYDKPFPVKEKRRITFKNTASNQMLCMDGNQTVVKETMNLMKWQFINETDTILNYLCRKAKMNFRGRAYIAWYTTEIPFKAAPWKIHSLPGVVLKMETTDGFYKLEVKKLSIVDSQKKIDNPFKEKKIKTWKEYTELYKEVKEDQAKADKAMGIKYGREYNMPSPKLEIIIDKNRVSIDAWFSTVEAQSRAGK